MTLVNGLQETIGQEGAANRCDAGGQTARDTMTPSQSPMIARGPRSEDIAVMFLLLMRQMDRLRQSSDNNSRKNDVEEAASRVD
ncbi:MAG TPA: hypothetical protein VKV73_29485 [Chloroflexota bacterium]|nr:hypothetical protein [Chloroflexota bacterium]